MEVREATSAVLGATTNHFLAKAFKSAICKGPLASSSEMMPSRTRIGLMSERISFAVISDNSEPSCRFAREPLEAAPGDMTVLRITESRSGSIVVR